MPASEYKNTISGGLKLKGAKDAGVKKPRKKKDKDKDKARDASTPKDSPAPERAASASVGSDVTEAGALQKALANEDEGAEMQMQEQEQRRRRGERMDGKTEAQRRHEEMRRKRLDERLKKEGVKTHKERVEELNKYLSTLSEHHDMPRIGPG